MGRIWVQSVTLMVMVSMSLWTPSSSTPTPRTPRPSRQNYYNYRPDYDDDQFDGDTNAFSSDFGLRTNRPTARTVPTQQTTYADEDPDPSDSWTDDNNEQSPIESPPIRPRDSSGGRSNGGWAEGPRVSTHHHQSTDGSYSFGYDLQDQSRHETSDSFGNVYGWYSYIDDDGFLHRVSYSAGAATGFVVHNGPKSRVRVPIKSPPIIIPESPKYRPHHHQHQPQWDQEEQEQDYRPTQRPWPSRRRKPSYVVKIRRPIKKEPAWVYFRPPNPGRFAPGWNSQPQSPKRPIKVSSWEDQSSDGWSDSSSGYPKDASYSFAYDAGTSNRQEYSDPWGTVRGSYSFVDPTGFRRTVHYTAGAATGFKILNAQPSSVVSTVYREPQVVHHQRQPSAFVYHLHPDGGWKPWEGRDEVDKPSGPVRRRKRPQNPNNAISHSYHYQSQGRVKPQQETLLKPTNRQRRPQYTSSKSDLEDTDDQQYSDGEQLILDETRYEALTDPGESKVTDPKIRGYQGGYGDKNPLLVMSGSNKSAEEQQQETTKKPGLSIAKMMSMRMAQAQRKGKNGNIGKGSRKPDHIPMTMSNSGRLMHYPRSQNQNDNNRSQLRSERRISQAEN